MIKRCYAVGDGVVPGWGGTPFGPWAPGTRSWATPARRKVRQMQDQGPHQPEGGHEPAGTAEDGTQGEQQTGPGTQVGQQPRQGGTPARQMTIDPQEGGLQGHEAEEQVGDPARGKQIVHAAPWASGSEGFPVL